MSAPTIVLFRADLRVSDHPALTQAAKSGPVVPLFVYDTDAAGTWAPGGASRWWLHHSLAALAESLAEIGSPLVIRHGDTVEQALDVAQASKAGAIYWSRGAEPWWRSVEDRLYPACKDAGLTVKRFAGQLLIDPDDIRTKSGDVYKVYTPFWKSVAERPQRKPLPAVKELAAADGRLDSLDLDALELLPTKPDWSGGFTPLWTPGEAGAHARLNSFLAEGLAAYDDERNRPDRQGTSRLSPHLHHGEISPAQCWAAVASEMDRDPSAGAETFLKEIVWREFSYHLLYHWPNLPEAPFRQAFAQFPWREDAAQLKAWQSGQTGYPIVDAGMRELWETGWMHNRVRMIVGSFLTKNLLLPWQFGEAWFWDCLVDADLASNAASWQWVSGSGADAAPYFRIFNAVTQGERYDPDGAYVRRWVPEIAGLETRYIHAPWTAPASALKDANVTLGETYPEPIVDHKETRERALNAYEKIKGGS